MATETRIQAHRGPLPSPDTLQRYEEILPGAAERILTMAEDQAKHRQSLEQKVVDGDISAQRLGLMIGGAVAVALGAVAAVIAVWASPVAGAVLGAVDIASIVGAFVYGRREKSEELRQRR